MSDLNHQNDHGALPSPEPNSPETHAHLAGSDSPPAAGQVLSSILMVTLVLGAMTFFLFNAFEIPIPGLDRAAAKTVAAPEALGVELVGDPPNTLLVPEDVRRALGILVGNQDRVAPAVIPTRTRPLSMSGSTALDPTKLMRIRARFPAEVVKITKVTDPISTNLEGKTVERELRAGDKVEENEVLAIFYSADVGNKKNDLIDALVQLKLDKEIYERAERAGSAVPEVFLLNARRNVETDRNAIARAYHTLRTWNIPDKDIEAVEAEAKEIIKRQGVRDTKNTEQWARVELRAPGEAEAKETSKRQGDRDAKKTDPWVIVERNVTVGEMVVDNTLNLFQLAKVDRLLVTANASEDELPNLVKFFRQPPDKRMWTIRTAGTSDEGIQAPIDEISYLVDPNQHSAVIKGYIKNPENRLRAGQYITASVELPVPENVVEIPMTAVVDDGRQCLIFVQSKEHRDRYTIRRVELTHRFEKTAFVRSKPFTEKEKLTPEDKEFGLFPREALQENEKVLLVGALELKKELEDQLNKAGK